MITSVIRFDNKAVRRILLLRIDIRWTIDIVVHNSSACNYFKIPRVTFLADSAPLGEEFAVQLILGKPCLSLILDIVTECIRYVLRKIAILCMVFRIARYDFPSCLTQSIRSFRCIAYPAVNQHYNHIPAGILTVVFNDKLSWRTQCLTIARAMSFALV